MSTLSKEERDELFHAFYITAVKWCEMVENIRELSKNGENAQQVERMKAQADELEKASDALCNYLQMTKKS